MSDLMKAIVLVVAVVGLHAAEPTVERRVDDHGNVTEIRTETVDGKGSVTMVITSSDGQLLSKIDKVGERRDYFMEGDGQIVKIIRRAANGDKSTKFAYEHGRIMTIMDEKLNEHHVGDRKLVWKDGELLRVLDGGPVFPEKGGAPVLDAEVPVQ